MVPEQGKEGTVFRSVLGLAMLRSSDAPKETTIFFPAMEGHVKNYAAHR